MSSFFRSLPPMPSPVPDFSELRSYFSTESTRLRGAARHFKDETAESLQAGLHRVSDGAAELSAFVKDQSSHAFDEATKMYHLALEIGKTRLLQYSELPHEWRNNEFIHTGYRYIPIEQWGALLRSGWEWHNEVSWERLLSHIESLLTAVLCHLADCQHSISLPRFPLPRRSPRILPHDYSFILCVIIFTR
jgi:adiponectin receptor